MKLHQIFEIPQLVNPPQCRVYHLTSPLSLLSPNKQVRPSPPAHYKLSMKGQLKVPVDDDSFPVMILITIRKINGAKEIKASLTIIGWMLVSLGCYSCLSRISVAPCVVLV